MNDNNNINIMDNIPDNPEIRHFRKKIIISEKKKIEKKNEKVRIKLLKLLIIKIDFFCIFEKNLFSRNGN